MKHFSLRGWGGIIMVLPLIYGFIQFLLNSIQENQLSNLNPEIATRQMFLIWLYGLFGYLAFGVLVVLFRKVTIKEFIFGDEREKIVDRNALSIGYYVLVVGICLAIAMPDYGAGRALFYSIIVGALSFSLIVVLIFFLIVEVKSALLRTGG